MLDSTYMMQAEEKMPQQRMTGLIPSGTLDMVGLWMIGDWMVMGTGAGTMLTLPLAEGDWLEQQRREYAFQRMLRDSEMRQSRKPQPLPELQVYEQQAGYYGLEDAPFYVLMHQSYLSVATLKDPLPEMVPVQRATVWVRQDVIVVANDKYRVWWGFDAAVRAWVVRDKVYRAGEYPERPVGRSVVGLTTAWKGQR